MGNLGLKTHNTLAQEVFQYDPWNPGAAYLMFLLRQFLHKERFARLPQLHVDVHRFSIDLNVNLQTQNKASQSGQSLLDWQKKFSTSVTNSDIPWLNNTLKFNMTSSEYWGFKLNNLQKNSQKIWIDQQTNSSSYTDNMQHLSDSVLN